MKSLSDISAAIFDIDGTLLDSSPVWENLGERFLRSRSVTPPDHISDILAPMTFDEGCAYLKEAGGLRESVSEIRSEVVALIADFYRSECRLKDGAAELVEKLGGRGVRLVLATAGDRELASAALEREGILRCFSGMFTCREYGPKTEPQIFLAAAESVNTSPEDCAVFEDSLDAVVTAKKAGFVTVGVKDISESQKRLLKSTADYYFDDLSVMMPLL